MTRQLTRVGLGLLIWSSGALVAVPPPGLTLEKGKLAAQTGPQPALTRVLIETELGEIEAEVDTGHAPITASNFLRYVEGGYYDGGRFFRAVRMGNQPNDEVKIEVIQAGANAEALKERKPFPPIPLERTRDTGILHGDGALSMARGAPDSATHSFSICIGGQPALDYGGMRNPDGQGFAAFGRVVRGMDVARKIQQQTAEGQTLKPPIKIIRVRVVPSSK
jgi:peptidyl-prolyl cis-trans isomerase A (cyclophilin A)